MPNFNEIGINDLIAYEIGSLMSTNGRESFGVPLGEIESTDRSILFCYRYNVVRCIPSTSQTNTYFPYDELADEILRKLPEETWKNSIIVHLFSMNGCASFLALWKKLSDDQKKFVKGIIFDRYVQDGAKSHFMIFWDPEFFSKFKRPIILIHN